MVPVALVGCDAASPPDETGTAPFVDEDVAAAIRALPRTAADPADNPFSDAKRELGQLLFWDPILSGERDVSCATCHHPDFGYADGRALSQGVGGIGSGPDRTGGLETVRNAPTVLNTGHNGLTSEGTYDPATASMFWTSSPLGLEGQALGPILIAVEMRGPRIRSGDMLDTVLTRLSRIPAYGARFEDAFGSAGITETRLAQALAAFERSLVAPDSPVDRYLRGDAGALTALEVQGMETFVDVGCAECHGGPMLSDFALHTLGVPERAGAEREDPGTTGSFDFRTPTLRNLSLTAPYMHNGVFDTLEEVVAFYDDLARGRGQVLHGSVAIEDVAPDARALALDREQIDEIVAFLHALTDEGFDRSRPAAVPSGLPPGGL